VKFIFTSEKIFNSSNKRLRISCYASGMDNGMHIYDLFSAALDIDYQEQGERWLDFLQQKLTIYDTSINGWGLTNEQASTSFPYPHWTYGPSGGENINQQLLMVPLDENGKKSLYLFLKHDSMLGEHILELWRRAANEAKERLNESNPEFCWAAVIKQLDVHSGSLQALKSRCTISDVNLRSGNKRLISREYSQIPQMGGYSINFSWPIVIEGKSKGHNWFAANNSASSDLNKLTALISLAWNSTWIVAQSPVNIDAGILNIPSPEPNMANFPENPRRYRTIPKWIGKAYEQIDQHPALLNALRAYYQGLLMQKDHPSFALVAFVVVLENVGNQILGERCQSCHSKNSSKSKFIAGIESVVTDKAEVKKLTLAYNLRSMTAHEGVLHGTEYEIGSMPLPSLFGNQNRASLFAFTELCNIRRIANLALLKQSKSIFHS
jgi:hypothetical protein